MRKINKPIDNKYYILSPRMSGSGGCMGHSLEKECNSLEEALAWQGMPEEDDDYGNYSYIICTSKNGNDSLYYFNYNSYSWKPTGNIYELDMPVGDPKLNNELKLVKNEYDIYYRKSDDTYWKIGYVPARMLVSGIDDYPTKQVKPKKITKIIYE